MTFPSICQQRHQQQQQQPLQLYVWQTRALSVCVCAVYKMAFKSFLSVVVVAVHRHLLPKFCFTRDSKSDHLSEMKKEKTVYRHILKRRHVFGSSGRLICHPHSTGK